MDREKVDQEHSRFILYSGPTYCEIINFLLLVKLLIQVQYLNQWSDFSPDYCTIVNSHTRNSNQESRSTVSLACDQNQRSTVLRCFF
ncbi:unnamed protein product [Caretta caretta]